MTGENLQLAISANAAIKSLLLDRETAVMERLEEASRHLSELVDNLESEFLNRSTSSPLPAQPGSQATGNLGYSELVLASQREYMQSTLQLLNRKEEAMERSRIEHNKIMKEVICSHEETIRHITQGREETTRALATQLLQKHDNDAKPIN